MAEELDLSEDDDALLDAAWDAVEQEGGFSDVPASELADEDTDEAAPPPAEATPPPAAE